MSVNVAKLSSPNPDRLLPDPGLISALEDRFILTQVTGLTLVFPATWVAEIVRIDRSQILDLPFYDRLLVGIVHHNGLVMPLIAAARLLSAPKSALPERAIVVRLNETQERLGNVGIIVDRAIGSTTGRELPPDIFSTSGSGSMVMMQSHLVPGNLWQPQSWSLDN
ncbi:chemotaxis protein CheW [Chamaesiphon minutus]|uniref:Chemotaxis protein histidine kinase-like protein n=1 Tax=Chamaesiphon minutus (strain ATCC 27169 / PCC 6605) TaxID=1173020 RepID=K9UMD6_CHAP6|nr:chemotaxis protein CheW [Chamaesiphon minutus]AFY95798.1 chemotaxis protein histidine kinase-like protein [Chamaesiphon minutus PCC 6605]